MNQEELIDKIIGDMDLEGLIMDSEDEQRIKEILENRINQYFQEN